MRKHKSVSFDESVDEVDMKNRKRAGSLNDAYDIPRKQNSLIDICAQSVKITPHDVATYSFSQKPSFNTFPRKNISRKQSLEHIYDEIPISFEITDAARPENKKDASETDNTGTMYGNQESIEKTKL